MTVVPPGYANVIISGTTDGNDRPWAIAHGYQIEALAQSDIDEMADNIQGSDWLDNAASDLNVNLLDVVVGTSDPSAPIHFTQGLTGSGGGGAPSGPNCAWLVRKNTLLGGRRGRGRTYFPGVTEGSVGDGGLVNEGDGSLRTGLEGFWNGITTSAPGFTDLVLLHEDASTPTVVQSWIMDTRIATQRRRLRR